jgi:hypothetical protein
MHFCHDRARVHTNREKAAVTVPPMQLAGKDHIAQLCFAVHLEHVCRPETFPCLHASKVKSAREMMQGRTHSHNAGLTMPKKCGHQQLGQEKRAQVVRDHPHFNPRLFGKKA